MQVRRKIGLKALELGGNAVTGYRQCFDLEGETGIVVRGIGTAVDMNKQTRENEVEATDNLLVFKVSPRANCDSLK